MPISKSTRRPVSPHSAKRETQNPEPRKLLLVRPAVIIAAIVLVYANSLSAPFIFDDDVSIVSNSAIRSLATAASQPPNTPLAGRPVAGLTFALNFALSDLDPSAYRLTNIAIHIVAALLLFGLVRRTLALPVLQPRFGSSANDLALAVALLWAVHPLTTDAVTYITQRTESLMALFYLATLYASLRAFSSQRPGLWHAFAVVSCVLGMGTKESMVTAPVVVVLFDRVFLYRSFREAFAARWRLYAGLALTWVFLAQQVITTPRSGSAGFGTEVSVWTYLLNQAVVITRYLRLVVWPADLVINYGPPVAYQLSDVLPHLMFISALLLLTLAAFRWSPKVAFLGAVFFITLAPSSSFVPIATEAAAERRMYLPLMAIAAGLVAGLFIWTRQHITRTWAAALVAVAMAALGAGTIHRNSEHQSWLVLSETTLERWPSDVAHAAVGGELTRLGRDEEALPFLRTGARSDARARYNLGVALYNLKRYDEAIRELEVLVAAYPMREEVPWSRRLMGHAYARLSRWPDAIAQLRMTLAMTPADAEARRILVDSYNSYGIDLAESQNFPAAITAFRDALGLDDRNATARYNLATALFDAGQMQESLTHAQLALAQNPDNADAYHLVGKLMALSGRMDEALASLETAARLHPSDELIREDLARLRSLRRGRP